MNSEGAWSNVMKYEKKKRRKKVEKLIIRIIYLLASSKLCLNKEKFPINNLLMW